MSSPSYLRLGGIALAVGSLIAIVSQVLGFVVPGPLGVQGPPAVWVAWIGAVGGVVTLVGVPALYTVQPKRLALLGLLGIIALFLAGLLFEVVLNILVAALFARGVPAGATAQPPAWVFTIILVGGILQLLASVLFGLAIVRTRVFPVWSGWALLIIGVLSAVSSFLPLNGLVANLISTALTLLFLLLLVWLGYLLAFRMANSAVGAQA